MDITVNGAKELEVDFAGASKKVQRASLRATNRAISSARAYMVQNIAKDTGLKSGDVRSAIPLREATEGRPVARIAASIKRIPLYKFGATGQLPSRGKGRGVSYRGEGGRQRIQSAFLAKMSSGHVGVYMRVAGGKRRGPKPQRSQLPIRELFGPSLGHVFAKFRPGAIARAREVFEKTFAHELQFRNSDAGAALSE